MTGLPPPPEPSPPRAPAGWYADLSAPGRLRYWDGTCWTGATSPPPGQPPGWYPDPIRPDLIRYWDGAGWVGPPQAGQGPYAAGPGYYATMPDGRGLRTEAGDWFELSGWWRRLGGYLLDTLIVGIPFVMIEVVIGLVFYSEPYGVLSLGRTHPAIAGPGPRIAVDLLSLALTFAYAVWLIGSRRQTFGMQAAGITAIDPSGRALTRRQVWMRSIYQLLFIGLWSLVVNVVSVVGTTDGHTRPGVTGVGGLITFGLYLLVYLWPLGNDRNQTLIDRAAGSVVVRGDRLGIAASHPL